MRNHFAQTLPFPKKDSEFTQNISEHYKKPNTFLLDQTTKKSSLYADQSILKNQVTQSFKTQGTISEQEAHQKQINSFRNIQNPAKACKFNPFFGKEKKPQPPKIQRSPQRTNIASSPNSFKQSKAMKGGPPVRSTLKTLLQTKGLTSFDKSFQNDYSRVESPNMKLNSSISVSRCNAENQKSARNSMKLLQKQNQILREQNEFLKHEMAEIKKHIMSVNTYKNEQTISNLRDTIKKQDNQIKELRVKLEISNKKVSTLNTLLENKDEEINFLSSKITQLEGQILQLKQKNAQKIQHLKEKMAIVFKSYTELEEKFNAQQLEWISFNERWMQEKSMYTHRINFLQSYISNNN